MRTGTLTLGQALALARNSRGLTQHELGEKIGMSKRSVQEWERDAISPLKHLGRIEEVLDLPEGWILGQIDPYQKLVELQRDVEEIKAGIAEILDRLR